MVTFKYLSDNVVGALELLRKNHENLMLGGVISTVSEFLGKCLVPQSGNSSPEDDFYRFIDNFLVMQNPRYGKYKKILYKDLRCGSAHTIMAKGGVALSYDLRSSRYHLNILKNQLDSSYRLWLYSPHLIEDMKEAIDNFIQRAEITPELEQNYLHMVEKLDTEGQQNIINYIPKEDLLRAEEIPIKGDIKI